MVNLCVASGSIGLCRALLKEGEGTGAGQETELGRTEWCLSQKWPPAWCGDFVFIPWARRSAGWAAGAASWGIWEKGQDVCAPGG